MYIAAQGQAGLSSINFIGLTSTDSTSSTSLSPKFASNVLQYQIYTTNEVSSLSFNASAFDNTQSITWRTTTYGQGQSVTSSTLVSIPVGSSFISIQVSRSTGETRNYYFSVSRAADTQTLNANLLSLTSAGAVLSPTFSPSTDSYSGSVDNSIDVVSFSLSTQSSSAYLSWSNVASTSSSINYDNLVYTSIPTGTFQPFLAIGTNIFIVCVNASTSSTLATKFYTISIVRGKY